MDFKLTAQEELLRKTVREFAENEIVPKVQQMEETHEPPMDIYTEMAKLNFMGVFVPKDYGGMGMGHLARMIMIEEVSRVSAAVGMALQIFHMGIAPILDSGSDEQKEKYLPALARGEKLGTVAVTEATGGSDPTGIQTTAELKGDTYILNGRKCFITNSHIADVLVIMAKTGEGSKGFSTFIVEKDMPGFRTGRVENKFGLHGCVTGELALDKCEVPKENLLGEEGSGLRSALKAIGEVGRPGMAACALGVLSASLEASVKYANQRVLYGKPIANLQGIQWLISDIFTDLEASRLLCYKAAWLKDQGVRCDTEMAMAKFFTTEAAVRCAKKAVDIHGGYGYMMEYPVQRYYRDSELLIASAGTSEIMRIVMARAALKS